MNKQKQRMIRRRLGISIVVIYIIWTIFGFYQAEVQRAKLNSLEIKLIKENKVLTEENKKFNDPEFVKQLLLNKRGLGEKDETKINLPYEPNQSNK